MRKPGPRDDFIILYALIGILAVLLACWAFADWLAWK